MTTVAGIYETQQRLGGSAVGGSDVWTARNLLTGELVVVKFLGSGQARQSSAHECLCAEVERMQALQPLRVGLLPSPAALALPELLDCDTEGTHPFFVLPLATDGSLASTPFSVPTTAAAVVTLLTQLRSLALALDAAHVAGFVHGDIKQENILRDTHNLLLVDWGSGAGGSSRRAPSVTGTPAYRPPGAETSLPSPALDRFAFALLVVELLTGRRCPFNPDPTSLRPALRGELASVNNFLTQTLSTHGRQPSSAAGLLHALTAALETTEVAADGDCQAGAPNSSQSSARTTRPLHGVDDTQHVPPRRPDGPNALRTGHRILLSASLQHLRELGNASLLASFAFLYALSWFLLLGSWYWLFESGRGRPLSRDRVVAAAVHFVPTLGVVVLGFFACAQPFGDQVPLALPVGLLLCVLVIYVKVHDFQRPHLEGPLFGQGPTTETCLLVLGLTLLAPAGLLSVVLVRLSVFITPAPTSWLPLQVLGLGVSVFLLGLLVQQVFRGCLTWRVLALPLPLLAGFIIAFGTDGVALSLLAAVLTCSVYLLERFREVVNPGWRES